MSEVTKIEWANSTGNPWIGCTKVSPGCKNCYAAELDDQRFSRTMGGGTKERPVSHWGKGAPRFRTKGFWKDAVRWNSGPFTCDTCGLKFVQLKGKQKLCEPIPGDPCQHCNSGRYARPRIFPSLCDWLDEEVPIEWLADLLKLIHDTPNLDWLLLTKRPELWRQRIQSVRLHHRHRASLAHDREYEETREFARSWIEEDRAPKNVWIGTSVENQEYADKRIPELLKIPARIRFLSIEPLLGPVHLDPHCMGAGGRTGDNYNQPQIHWAIIGGESGKGARPCQPQWIREIVEQCRGASVPVFVKQLGANVHWDPSPDAPAKYADRVAAFEIKHPKGGNPDEWPEDLRVRQFPV